MLGISIYVREMPNLFKKGGFKVRSKGKIFVLGVSIWGGESILVLWVAVCLWDGNFMQIRVMVSSKGNIFLQ